MGDKDSDGPPSAKALDDGYNQTYLIMKDNFASEAEMKVAEGTEVFFRCGNWCYKGQIQFTGLKIGTEDLPVIIPTLQRQQGSLRYFCNAKSVPVESDFAQPIEFLAEATEFIAQEVISEGVEKEMRRMASVFSWIDEDAAATYFELSCGNVPEYMDKIALIASKTYVRGLIIISIFHESSVYFLVSSGEGDQPLLDVRFPDVSKHGQGLHLNSYNDHTVCWRKLVLWHILDGGAASATSAALKKEIPKLKTVNVSNKNYEQTYIIMKSSFDTNSPTLSVHHDVLFRFGSWCYSGRVQLTPSLNLADIPYVIPALRMQQSRLDYLCDVSQVPTTSPFASALEYVQYIMPRVEAHIVDSEDVLKSLIERLSNMGLGESVSRWLEGDPTNSFFEFKIAVDAVLSQKFKSVELIVSKCYLASGVIVMTIIYQFSIYVTVLEGRGENPLLDSRFPDVSGKGRGYQIQVYNDGADDWPALRKVSVWQTVGALEQEFRERASQLAQAKRSEDDDAVETLIAGGGLAKGGDIESASSDTRVGPGGGRDREREGEGDEFTATSTDIEAIAAASAANGLADAKAVVADALREVSSTSSDPASEAVPFSSAAASSAAAADDKRVGDSEDRGSKDANASAETPAVDPVAQPRALKSLAPLGRGASIKQALPHHVPKVDALSKRLDEIRKNMGDQGMTAPWDMRGRPLGAAALTQDSSDAKK